MTSSPLRVGELFFLGFRGTEIPQWLIEFEARFGLGGVILFDYNCQTRTYENNIISPSQVRALNEKISELPSKPLILVDQEGGKVRRLKEKLGFAPLPSAKAFNQLPRESRKQIALKSFEEQRSLGFHYDLAPVIDLDFNPENPDIGKIERSFSALPSEVRACIEDLNSAAQEADLGLCLKHYPGLGAATVNSHEELTDLSGTLNAEQLELFYEAGKLIHGSAVLLSHGVLKEWDPHFPVSMSEKAVSDLRKKLPDALFFTDDLQMQGLQKILPSEEACLQAVRAGVDGILIGNNLIPNDQKCLNFAEAVSNLAIADPKIQKNAEESIQRIATRKKHFYR